jgi:hypothetical protein
MNNIPSQETSESPPLASSPVPVIPDTAHRFRAKIVESALIVIGAVAQWLPTAVPQFQQDYPKVKWASVLLIVGFAGMLVRNLKEAGQTQQTNFSPQPTPPITLPPQEIVPPGQDTSP